MQKCWHLHLPFWTVQCGYWLPLEEWWHSHFAMHGHVPTILQTSYPWNHCTYVPGSAKIFDNLGDLEATLSVLDPAGLVRARMRLWLTVFSLLVSWLHPTDPCLL